MKRWEIVDISGTPASKVPFKTWCEARSLCHAERHFKAIWNKRYGFEPWHFVPMTLREIPEGQEPRSLRQQRNEELIETIAQARRPFQPPPDFRSTDGIQLAFPWRR